MSHMNTKVLREAKRLYDLGFGIHWLHPHSKRPLEHGWTTGPRKKWEALKDSYAESFNVGVRLGTASQISGKGSLAVIDVDVKSSDVRHANEALAAVKKLLGGTECPVVLSGRGNGSRHYYCVTKAPFKTFNPAHSDEFVKVYMPSKKASKRELAELSETEIKSGMRLSRAWEVSLYSDGRQVVLPPSIHPDSNRPYTWAKNIGDIESLPLVEFDIPTDEEREEGKASSTPKLNAGTESKPVSFDFEVSPVMIDWLEMSDKVKKGILTGEGVEDRSGFLLPACTALLSAGCSRDEILTVLTDRKTYLGECAYDHAKTNDRTRAARWLWRYTLKRVMEERSAEGVFEAVAEISEPKKLSDEEKEKQSKEMEAGLDWRTQLDRTARGEYRPTLNNCIAILTHASGRPDIVGRDEFAVNDFYLHNSPWRTKKAEAVKDIDIIRFKVFSTENFGIEFADKTIDQAFQHVADLNRFHPVKDWLNSLKWDGVKRADTWLKDYARAKAPEPYLSEVSRKFLVAMIARVFNPGAKFDTMIILEGNQGAGKSTLLRKLAGDAWFTDAALVIGDKDSVLTIQSKWIVELGELSAMSKAETEVFKAFVSQAVDRIRAPYGKRVEEFPRQNVFAGTTNLDEYLRDLTGNRRYWVVKLEPGKIDFEGVERIRDQLFAEAFTYFKAGEKIFLEGLADMQAKGEQGKRLQTDEWFPRVQEIVNAENFPRDGFEMREIANKMDREGAHRLATPDTHRIGKCLRMLGYVKFQEHTGKRRKLWKAGPETTLPEPCPTVPEFTNVNDSLDYSELWNTDF